MADKERILELIERAAKEGWIELGLSFNQLTSVPPGITKLTKLTDLYLALNQLTSACYLPARRAASIDPIEALRYG